MAPRHAVEAEKAFEALLARSRRDNEEATKVRKEWDELLQKDVETHQQILDLLAEVEKERELKLAAEEKLAALENKASLDALAVAQLHKERDELLQKDAETHQQILDLLAEVEKDRELNLGAEEKLTALEKRASLDVAVVAWLRKERDELLQIVERLHSECGTAHEEHDQAFQEHDQACQERDDAQ